MKGHTKSAYFSQERRGHGKARFNVIASTRVRGADVKRNTVKQSFVVTTAKTEREAEALIRRKLSEFGFTIEDVKATLATLPETQRPGSAPAFSMKRRGDDGRRGRGFFGFK